MATALQDGCVCMSETNHKSKHSPPKPEEEPRVDVRTQRDAFTWTISHLTMEIKGETGIKDDERIGKEQ